jgi:hypothetical protein
VRRAAKRDTAEAEIIQTLKACGFTVVQLSQPNVPDLMLSRPGWCGLAEVKTGKKRLRPGQEQFAGAWPTKVWVLRSVDDALALAKTLGC